jgi:hypothetical protein
MRQRNGTDPREETEADLKPKTEKERRQLVVAFVFFLQVTVIGTIGREEEQKLSRTHHFSGKSRRRVKQRAAINGGASEHAPPAVPASNSCAEGFPCNFWSFEDCFVKFGLFDVVFIYF